MPTPPAVRCQGLALSRKRLSFREDARFHHQEAPTRTRTGKRQRTSKQLSLTSSSTAKGQANSNGSTPTAAAAPINHVRLQHPRHGLLFVSCRDTGRQFLVDCGSAVTLWPQSQPLCSTRPVNVKLTSTSGNTIPTLGTTKREIVLEGQLFSHTYICAKVKHPILGRDFWLRIDSWKIMLGDSSHKSRLTFSSRPPTGPGWLTMSKLTLESRSC